ncbi:hypothetical protein [Paraburkholderia sacchari]|uniref:hypothetical protein n=1 Tax=Paraburkholderia sacchari TaxID=159450 RepID=UPI00126A2B8B|nr:hypothetical protein [Paraburkholderia sacchari]
MSGFIEARQGEAVQATGDVIPRICKGIQTTPAPIRRFCDNSGFSPPAFAAVQPDATLCLGMRERCRVIREA